jgi:hypothetical protein
MAGWVEPGNGADHGGVGSRRRPWRDDGGGGRKGPCCWPSIECCSPPTSPPLALRGLRAQVTGGGPAAPPQQVCGGSRAVPVTGSDPVTDSPFLCVTARSTALEPISGKLTPPVTGHRCISKTPKESPFISLIKQAVPLMYVCNLSVTSVTERKEGSPQQGFSPSQMPVTDAMTLPPHL